MYLLGIAFLLFIVIIAIAIFVVGINYASFTIVFMNVSVTASYLIGTGLYRDLVIAFKLASHKYEDYSMEELKRARTAINSTMMLIIISGVIGILLGAVPLLTMYDALKDVKPYTSFTIISVIYSVFGVLFLQPIRARLSTLPENEFEKMR